jgi:hypothetical protein
MNTPRHPIVRPVTLTPREQVRHLTEADALLIYARVVRERQPDVAMHLVGLAAREMAVVVRSRLIAQEWKPR